MMVNITSRIEVNLQHEEYDHIVQGEPKSLISFLIHPDSYEHIWWVWGPESRNENVKNGEDLDVEDIDDLDRPITGNYIQIERDILFSNNDNNKSSVYDMFYKNLIDGVFAVSSDGSDARGKLTDSILSESREIIAAIDTNKSVVISMKIHGWAVVLIEKEDIMKYLDTLLENFTDGEGEETTSSSSSICTICLEGKSSGMIVMPCSRWHKFHKECITQWLRRSYLCPICRSDVMIHCVIDHYEDNTFI